MSRIHFVKEGKTPNNERLTSTYDDVPFNVVKLHLGNCAYKYSGEPPTINPEVIASHLAEHKFVVLEVEEKEAGLMPFQEPGYYWLVGLSPSECQTLLGLNGPLI